MTADSAASVTVCVGKTHSVDATELYLAKAAGFCGPGVKKLKWSLPDGNGTIVLCVGDGNDDSDFHTELYLTQKGKCVKGDHTIALSKQGPKGVSLARVCVAVKGNDHSHNVPVTGAPRKRLTGRSSTRGRHGCKKGDHRLIRRSTTTARPIVTGVVPRGRPARPARLARLVLPARLARPARPVRRVRRE